jgi:DNA-binding CsgD family transcriptional regulator
MADAAVSVTRGVHRALALTTRCHIAVAQGNSGQAERDAHDALSVAASVGAYLAIPGILECLASLAADAGRSQEAVRLVGAAHTARQHMGVVCMIHRAGVDSSLTMLRKALGDNAFDAAWAEGAALSTDEAIAYAQRGRGERKRPASGWESLTPTELDVARLVSEGLANKEIGARLFISPRTVQTHLTHVYTKLALTSRVQLAQAAVRHDESKDLSGP